MEEGYQYLFKTVALTDSGLSQANTSLQGCKHALIHAYVQPNWK